MTGRSWDFGDNTAASTETNPLHLYSADGPFTVTLHRHRRCGNTGTVSRQMTVIGRRGECGSDRGLHLELQGIHLQLHRRQQRHRRHHRRLELGLWRARGHRHGELKDPSHVYAGEGTYTVTLTSTDNRGGTGTVTKRST